MKNYNFNKKINAFTLVEITLVITIMSVLILLALNTMFGSEKTKLRKVAAYSSSFYSNISSSFQGIVMKNTRNYTLENLNDKNNDNNIDSTDLAIYFTELMGGELLLPEGNTSTTPQTPPNPDTPSEGEEDTGFVTQNDSCKNLKILSDSPIANYAQNATCGEFNKIIAGFVYDKSCSLSINAKEYLTKEDIDNISSDSSHEPPIRNVGNLCGYVVYGVSDGKGEFKKDLFTIPFGKRSIK